MKSWIPMCEKGGVMDTIIDIHNPIMDIPEKQGPL